MPTRLPALPRPSLHQRFRVLALPAFALLLFALLLGQVRAGGSHFFPPVTDSLVREECGSCHLAYPPSMLPARSWQRLMAGLDQHFGDDATVDAKTGQKITDYLTRHAADAGGERYGRKLLRGLPDSATPLRISELPKWQREHRRYTESDWRQADIRSRANCAACHPDAERGFFHD